MPRKLSKIVCPVCGKIGGSLTLRRAGNAKNVKYFYIKHFSPLAKHRNASCYIGRTYRLADVRLNDKRYQAYEKTVKSVYLYPQDYSQHRKLRMEAAKQLQHLKFPKPFGNRKFTADIAKSYPKKVL